MDFESENKELKKQVAQWQHEYEVLDACIEIYEQKVKELKQENERLKAEFEIETLIDNDTGEKYYRSRIISNAYANKIICKYEKCLQEIKEILLQAMDVKSNAYNHFLKVEQAIDLITKAESEG